MSTFANQISSRHINKCSICTINTNIKDEVFTGLYKWNTVTPHLTTYSVKDNSQIRLVLEFNRYSFNGNISQSMYIRRAQWQHSRECKCTQMELCAISYLQFFTVLMILLIHRRCWEKERQLILLMNLRDIAYRDIML